PTALVWLFDVDSTLLTTRGAAKQAFVLTVKERLGIDDPLDDIGFAGRTEPVILGDILRKHGLHLEPSEVQAFWNAVLSHMAVVYEPGRGTLLAGVTELL